MTVDPGIGGTGVALWDVEFDRIPNPSGLRDVWNITAKGPEVRRVQHETYGWIEKVHYIVGRCAELAHEFSVQEAYCEFPAFHGGSAGGQMVAARGDLVKLTFFVGYWACEMMSLSIVPKMVTVQEWKGQLPKSVCHRRIRSILNGLGEGPDLDNMSTHVLDAVGIGLYVAGVF